MIKLQKEKKKILSIKLKMVYNQNINDKIPKGNDIKKKLIFIYKRIN